MDWWVRSITKRRTWFVFLLEILQFTNSFVERLMKEWISPVYGFFHPKPRIEILDGHQSHIFKCEGKSCKTTICCFLDTKDARSTGNMQKHVKSYWGIAALQAADSTKNPNDVWTKIVCSILRDGSITAFERKGNGKTTYSNRPLTCAETKAAFVRWVCESLHSFDIISNMYFLVLMKTGWPGFYIPSPSTVSCDFQLVFAHTWDRIAKLLNVSITCGP